MRATALLPLVVGTLLFMDSGNANLLLLDDTISFSDSAKNRAVVEQMESGGIRMTFKNDSDEEGVFMVYVRKTLNPPRIMEAIDFRIEGVEKSLIVEMFTEEKKVAYTHVRPLGEVSIDLARLTFKGTKDPFAGKVAKISIGIPIPKMAGEHVIELEGLLFKP